MTGPGPWEGTLHIGPCEGWVPRTQPLAENWLRLETKATCSLSTPLWLLGAHCDGARGTSLLLWGGGQDRPGSEGPSAV